MEKLRNSRSADLSLTKIERERNALIVHAFREFNSHFVNNQVIAMITCNYL